MAWIMAEYGPGVKIANEIRARTLQYGIVCHNNIIFYKPVLKFNLIFLKPSSNAS